MNKFTVRKLKYRPWPVTVELLNGDDNGDVVAAAFTFVLHFSFFSESQYEALIKEVFGETPTTDAATTIVKETSKTNAEILDKNAEFFPRLVEGWSAVIDDDGVTPLPYSAVKFADMITGPDGMALSIAINKAVSEIRFGRAPAKNLSASLAPGESSSAAGAVVTS